MDTRITEILNNKKLDYVTPFLWLHNEDDSFFIKEIERIHNSGINSVCLESRTHDKFCCDEWWEDVGIILNECQKRDMKVWILDDKHFPSGFANDIFKNEYNSLRPYAITEYHVDVAGPVKDGSLMADCWIDSDFYCNRHNAPEDMGKGEIMGVFALRHIPDTERFSEILDITEGLSDGMVYFDLPEGQWRIVFIVKTRAGYTKTTVNYCDMLNPDAIDLYIKYVHQAHYDRMGKYFGNTFAGFFSDEPCFHNNSRNGAFAKIGEPFVHHPWNDRLYEIIDVKKLPGLWFEIENISDEIRHSFMDKITLEYKKNYSDKLGEWCRKHNVMFIGHVVEDNNNHAGTDKGAGHYFRALSGQDMAGVDVVLHQIVPGLAGCDNTGFVSYRHMNSDFFTYYLAKLASSMAHTDPKKKGRALCEIFGAYGWAEGTKTMKYLMDHMLVRGINYFVPHAFSPKPDDTDCPPTFYDGGKNPHYPYYKNNMDYMNRMCHLLSCGTHISSCAILYDAENHWINRDFVPLEKIAKVLYDNYYDYDIIPADYLEKICDSSLNGEKYNVLFVPYSKSIPQSLLKKLKKADIKVVMVSVNKNENPDDFECISLSSISEYMKEKNFNDIICHNECRHLRYYHYTRDNAHIYMFANENINETADTLVTLSSFKGGKYIEYDGFENKATIKHSPDSNIRLNLNPYNSTVIIFGDVEMNGTEEYSEKILSAETLIKPEFDIYLMEGKDKEYKFFKKTNELFNITGKDYLPHFSGYIRYEGEIELKKQDCVLDLGYTGETAEVYLNDKYIGTRQFPPYRFEIPKEYIIEKNKLKIIVSNHNGYAKRDEFSKFLLFEPSGIMGPMKVYEIK